MPPTGVGLLSKKGPHVVQQQVGPLVKVGTLEPESELVGNVDRRTATDTRVKRKTILSGVIRPKEIPYDRACAITAVSAIPPMTTVRIANN